MRNSFLAGCPPPPAWDLPLVLRALARHPFKPMASCNLRLLSWKTAFLVAITSAYRVSELVALRRVQPYLTFLPHSVHLPKVVSDFHILTDIVQPDFYSAPTTDEHLLWHTLDIQRALFYVHRTKFPVHDGGLFVCYFGGQKGQPVSSQRLCRWITATIELAYTFQKVPVPTRVTVHSTRVKATSVAPWHGVSLHDICTAATWALPNTVVRHYAIGARAWGRAPVARAALSTISG